MPDLTIAEVTAETLADAGFIHSGSWQASHASFCSAEFVQRHTPQAQTEYLRREMAAGKRLFMLTDGQPVGIVSVQGSLIENLYVLPEAQGKGYGTRLLEHAVRQCSGTPTLWILSNNEGARRLYARRGFRETGRQKRLSDVLCELEMMKADAAAEREQSL